VNKPNGKSQAKVLDFGLAQIDMGSLGGWASRSLDLTVAGSTVGTLAYMSPEQARGQTLDARSDLFSLGVVMYEMATRQVPFKGTTSALIYVQLLEHAPDPVRSWNESIPRELDRVMLRLLAKDRRERFQTAKELQDALGKIAGKIGKGGWLKKGAAVPLVRATEPVARERRPARRPSGTRGAAAGEAISAGRLNSASSGAWVSRSSQPSQRSAGVRQSGDMLADVQAAGDSFTTLSRSRGSSDGAVESGTRQAAMAKNRTGVPQVEHGGDVAGSGAAKVQAGRLTGARLAIAAVLTLAVVVGAFLLVRSGRLRPAVLGPTDRLLLTKVQNSTGDKVLEG